MKMVSYQVVDKNGKPYVQVKVGDENKVLKDPIPPSWPCPSTSPHHQCNISHITRTQGYGLKSGALLRDTYVVMIKGVQALIRFYVAVGVLA